MATHSRELIPLSLIPRSPIRVSTIPPSTIPVSRIIPHRKSARLVFGIVLVVAVLLFPPGAAAQETHIRARLDSLFTTLDSNQRVMGAITIRKADRVLFQRAIGYRDSTESGWILSDDQTGFRVGSVTKPFTAVLIYRLIDEGRLSLDTELSRFFPEIPGSAKITIRDLLGHTSGLTDYTQTMDPMELRERASLLKSITAQPPQFEPGTKRRYSNSNYLLLGYIVEAVTKSSYEEQLVQQITDRIGLERTRLGGPVTPAANESRAYFFNGGHWDLQPDHVIENAGGAGGIVSTSRDLTAFLGALFQGRLLSEVSLSEMTHGFNDGSRINGKGLGPFSIPGTSKTGFSHDGSIGAHSALIGYVPEDSLSLALTINGLNYPINRLFFLVWGILYGTDVKLPSFTQVALADTTATSLVGTYSAEAYGLTITIRQGAAAMEAQAEGQDPFPLTYVGNRRFLFVPDGIIMDFDAPVDGASPRFVLYQQQAAIPLTRSVQGK